MFVVMEWLIYLCKSGVEAIYTIDATLLALWVFVPFLTLFIDSFSACEYY